jgi:glycolate oxidase
MVMALDRKKTEKIKKTLPRGRVFFDFESHPEYTRDATELVYLPDALFFAESEDDILSAVRLCRELSLPLIIRGAGTGYSGGALAVNGGILLSIERLDSIEIDKKRKMAVVGPGAITSNIMKAAEAVGLFYPPDPASYEESTIGGNLAENAGGLRCKKYGVTRDYVMAVRGTDASGKIIEIDHLSPFGLIDLMIGSEGTLFIFTEITLRLIDHPEPGKTILATFEKAVDAALTIAEVTASGIVPCIMEIMDGDAIECSNQYDPEHRIDGGAAMLLFETDGPLAPKEADFIIKICNKHAPLMLRMAEDKQEREMLWKTRRNLSNAVKAAAETKTSEDVCVPPSKLPDLVAFSEELGRSSNLRVNCYGHAGDGNLHINFLGVTDSEQEKRDIVEAVERLFAKTLELGGTLSGEHGIGITKKDYLHHEFDPPTLDFMRRLGNCLNPVGLLNPGKIFV